MTLSAETEERDTLASWIAGWLAEPNDFYLFPDKLVLRLLRAGIHSLALRPPTTSSAVFPSLSLFYRSCLINQSPPKCCLVS